MKLIAVQPERPVRHLGDLVRYDRYDEAWKGAQPPDVEVGMTSRGTQKKMWNTTLTDARIQGLKWAPRAQRRVFTPLVGRFVGVAAAGAFVAYLLHGVM